MLDFHDIPGSLRDHIVIPAVDATDMTESFPIWHAPFDAKIRDIVVIWGDDLTGNVTDYTRVTVTDRGTDGTGSTTLATVNYNSGAVTGYDAYALYDPATYDAVDSGTVISIELIAVSSGENMPPAAIFVSYEGA